MSQFFPSSTELFQQLHTSNVILLERSNVIRRLAENWLSRHRTLIHECFPLKLSELAPISSKSDSNHANHWAISSGVFSLLQQRNYKWTKNRLKKLQTLVQYQLHLTYSLFALTTKYHTLPSSMSLSF
ncbi:hypothetical protein GEMRC1_001200 [Eukaryota sp. GEM-RC1]